MTTTTTSPRPGEFSDREIDSIAGSVDLMIADSPSPDCEHAPIVPNELNEFFGMTGVAERIFRDKRSKYVVEFVRVNKLFHEGKRPQLDWLLVETKAGSGAISFSSCRTVEEVGGKVFEALYNERLDEWGADRGMEARYAALAALREERGRAA